MNMHRPIRTLGLQPQLLEYIENLDYTSDPVQLVPLDRARAIVDSLGWPSEPGLHILACRLSPGSASAIHQDRNSDGTVGLRWGINVPIKDTWGTWMEWFDPVGEGEYYTIANPVDGTNVPALKRASSRCIARSKDSSETAYIARNDQWHRVVNMTDRTSWCVSVRYYPLSSEPWDMISAKTPWLRAIAQTGRA